MRAILAMVALAIASPSTPAIASGQSAVQRLTVTRPSGTTTATCTLIHRDDTPQEVVLYFLTAGRMFRTADGERLPIAESVVVGRGSQAITIRPQGILLPLGNIVDIALLRVTVPQADLQPEPITWETPAAGAAFVVTGFDRTGTATDVDQHVRFTSTILVVGDRGTSDLDRCIGAPATTAAGMFGIVTSCEPRRTPLVTLLRPARSFIGQYLPVLARPSITSQLTIFDREIARPAVDIPYTGQNAGEIEKPLPLRRDEWVLDGAPALVHSEEVRLADMPAIHLGDRSVTLRFSIGGGSPSPWALDCPQPQALVTLRVTFVTTARE